MNAHDRDSDIDTEKLLDEYIDALNAGRPAPPPADDADLAALFATARDIHRLRSTEPDRTDVPSRLAAALERELRANPTDTTRRNESNDMSRFRHASSNGSLRPPGEAMTAYPLPKRPERARQWAQFAVAAVAFIMVGVILAQIIGGGHDDGLRGVGSDPSSSPTPQASPTTTNGLMLPDDVSTLPPDVSTTATATVAGPTATRDQSTIQPTGDPTTTSAPVVEPTAATKATPTAPAIAPEFVTLQVTPDYVTCDDTVIARGVNFTAGTTVVIYGGPLFGDNFGPVSDDVLVADNGGFEVVLDIGRIFAQCRGANVQQDGAQFLLSAETGSTKTKGGFDGPSALAVITFSSTAPDVLKNRPRLPSCGVEIIRTETEMAPQGEPNVQGRECFAAAAAAGSAAEFSSYVQMQDFWIQTTIYRTIGNGEVVGIIGSAARGIWEQYDCTGISLQDQEPYEFQFETCGRPQAIE